MKVKPALEIGIKINIDGCPKVEFAAKKRANKAASAKARRERAALETELIKLQVQNERNKHWFHIR